MNTKLLRQTYAWLNAKIEDRSSLANEFTNFDKEGHNVVGELPRNVAFACLTLMNALYAYLPYLIHDGGESKSDSLWRSFFTSKNFQEENHLFLAISDVEIECGEDNHSEDPETEFDRLIRIEIKGLLDDFKEYVLDPLDDIEAVTEFG